VLARLDRGQRDRRKLIVRRRGDDDVDVGALYNLAPVVRCNAAGQAAGQLPGTGKVGIGRDDEACPPAKRPGPLITDQAAADNGDAQWFHP
jgi:hypothetical protein